MSHGFTLSERASQRLKAKMAQAKAEWDALPDAEKQKRRELLRAAREVDMREQSLEEVVRCIIDEQTRLGGSLAADVILRRCLMYLRADVTSVEAEQIAGMLQGMNLPTARRTDG